MSYWSKLSMKNRANVMRLFLDKGISDLDTMRREYNIFAEGGNTNDADLVDWIIREEGFNKKPEDIGDGKMTLGSGLTSKKWHDLYRKRGNKWSAEDNRMAVAEEVANRRRWAEKTIPNWEVLPDSSQKALLSYKYNYDFTPTNSPKLFKALADSNFREAARQMDATSKDPKFKEGLMKRRLREQEWFLSDLANQSIPEPTPAPAPVVINTSLPEITAPAVSTAVANNYVPSSVHPYTRRENARRAMESAAAFNRMIEDTSIQNNLSEYQFPIGNGYANGGKIHIKPENKGKFTALKKRTGHSASWFKAHGTPAQKKMATFALNAAKWKHGYGGNLYGGITESTQQMQTGKDYWAQLANKPTWLDTFITPLNGGQLSEVVVTPTDDEKWLLSIGKYAHNNRKPLADSYTRKVVADYLSKFDYENARDYNARIKRLADAIYDTNGTQFQKNDRKNKRAYYDPNTETGKINDMNDIFSELAHPYQEWLGNNNLGDELSKGYDNDKDPRGGTRYAYPDTFEGETHGFFEPALKEWIETGKIGRSLSIINKNLSKEKIVPNNRTEVTDSAASWDKQAIGRRILADPNQLPMSKKIQYSIFDYPLLDKRKAYGGNLYNGTSQPSQQMDNSYTYYKPLENIFVDNNKLTPQKAQQFRKAMKHVGAYAIPTVIAAETLYGKQE